ncbi:MAG TPA: RNA polymerase sigma factor [Solirubrobacteraceae bacterium]|nr:RNA polymerase sigma factor [Solirubrobacteraceae bacterium]
MTSRADTDHFAALFDRHAAELLRYCFRRPANASAAEDLVSLVFLEAWRLRDRLDTDADPLPWLYGIATNLLRQRWRMRRRHAAALTRIAAVRPHGEGADEVLAREHEMRVVLEAVAGLPRREQDVLALCVWTGLSYEEAARVLGVPVGTVRSRLSRARERLRATTSPTPLRPDRPLP